MSRRDASARMKGRTDACSRMKWLLALLLLPVAAQAQIHPHERFASEGGLGTTRLGPYHPVEAVTLTGSLRATVLADRELAPMLVERAGAFRARPGYALYATDPRDPQCGLPGTTCAIGEVTDEGVLLHLLAKPRR